MASVTSLPRKSHLEAVFQMCLFLKSKHNGVTVFDPTEPDIDITQFPTECWPATSYSSCKEHVQCSFT